MHKSIYIAIPYKGQEEKSYFYANEVAARYIKDGFIVFSPISHSHEIADAMPAACRNDHEIWLKQDLFWLAKCDTLLIVMLQGWNESKGVRLEFEKAVELGKEIMFYDPYWCKEVFSNEMIEGYINK